MSQNGQIFKNIDRSDYNISPYLLKKSWTYNTSSFSNAGIQIDNINSNDYLYNTINHVYYETKPYSTSTNKNIELTLTDSLISIGIPQIIYGEKIEPDSLEISYNSSGISIVDDGYGNLNGINLNVTLPVYSYITGSTMEGFATDILDSTKLSNSGSVFLCEFSNGWFVRAYIFDSDGRFVQRQYLGPSVAKDSRTYMTITSWEDRFAVLYYWDTAEDWIVKVYDNDGVRQSTYNVDLNQCQNGYSAIQSFGDSKVLIIWFDNTWVEKWRIIDLEDTGTIIASGSYLMQSMPSASVGTPNYAQHFQTTKLSNNSIAVTAEFVATVWTTPNWTDARHTTVCNIVDNTGNWVVDPSSSILIGQSNGPVDNIYPDILGLNNDTFVISNHYDTNYNLQVRNNDGTLVTGDTLLTNAGLAVAQLSKINEDYFVASYINLSNDIVSYVLENDLTISGSSYTINTTINPNKTEWKTSEYGDGGVLYGIIDGISLYVENYFATTGEISQIHVGNIFYENGNITIIDTGSFYSNFSTGSSSDFSLEFQGNHTIYEHEIQCLIDKNEFNNTLNPTAYSGSLPITDITNYPSDWTPYITSIGLYDDLGNLLVVGKLAKPIKNINDMNLTFVVKFDI